MKKSLLICGLLILGAAPGFAQNYTIYDGNPEREKLSTVMPRLAYASRLFKENLRRGLEANIALEGAVLTTDECDRYTPHSLDLKTGSETTWQLSSQRGLITLAWNMEPASAIGASGSYTIGYNKFENRIFQRVHLARANQNLEEAKLQDILETMLVALDQFESLNVPYRYPEWIEIRQNEVFVRSSCRQEMDYLFSFQTGPNDRWFPSWYFGSEPSLIVLDWMRDPNDHGENKINFVSLGYHYISDNQSFPIEVMENRVSGL